MRFHRTIDPEQDIDCSSRDEFFCETCKRGFHSLERLGRHRERKGHAVVAPRRGRKERGETSRDGDEDLRTSCWTCSRTFSSSERLEAHCRRKGHDMSNDRYQDDEFKRSSNSKEHGFREKDTPTANEEASTEDPVCGVCGRGFRTPEKLSAHCKRTGHPPKGSPNELLHFAFVPQPETPKVFVTPFACSECGKCFSRNEVLRNHIEGVHQNRRRFSCSTCGKSFKYRSNLENHELYQHDEPSGGSTCPLCRKIVRGGSSNLFEHLRLVHANLKRKFQCFECQRLFKRKSELKVHALVHNPDHKIPCETCGKNFKHRQSLTRHKRNTCPGEAQSTEKGFKKRKKKTPALRPTTSIEWD